jgi:thioredoxin 1
MLISIDGSRSAWRSALLGACLAVLASGAWALDVMDYSAELLAERQQTGRSVALHFCASWCTTCAAQKQVLAELQDDPSLEEMRVLVVDFDREKALRHKLKVKRPGAIIVFKGAQEVGRSVGQTAISSIWVLLSRAK